MKFSPQFSSLITCGLIFFLVFVPLMFFVGALTTEVLGLYPLINAIPRRAGFLDSTEPTEVLYRRFEWPMSLFEFANPEFDASQVARIGFVFDQSPKGAIIVDDILFATRP